VGKAILSPDKILNVLVYGSLQFDEMQLWQTRKMAATCER